jgi:hypothetical protein
MTNTDNKYGTHNKLTKILSQINDGSTALQNFADVAEAKAYFFSDAAIAVFDECCTELQWAVVDNQKLKYTMAFGTKGDPTIGEANDWAGLYVSRTNALADAGTLSDNEYTEEESSDHLF